MRNKLGETNNVIVVAGGAWQTPLIQFLQSKGHPVCVVDPYDDSPGVLIADKHIKCDVRDEELIFSKIKDVPKKWIVTDQSDISVESANNLSQRFGLPHNPASAVEVFVNKHASRQFCAEAQMPAPEWRRVDNAEQLSVVIAELGLPLILKPPDNQASCGVHKIDEQSIHRLDELLLDCLANTRKGFVLCERFVEGLGITVEGFCSGGKHRCFAAATRGHFESGVISSLLYFTDLPQALLERIFAAIDRYVERSGLKFGITHTELIVDVPGDRFWLVEMACRGGGTRVSSDIAKWVSGVGFYDLLYSELSGSTTDVKKLELKRRSALLEFFEFGEGVVTALSGVEDAKQLPGVCDLKVVFSPGDTIKLAKNGRTRQGFYIAFGETHADVRNIGNQIYETIKVKLTYSTNVAAQSPQLIR